MIDTINPRGEVNRANAQHSRSPAKGTPEGKQRASLNAL